MKVQQIKTQGIIHLVCAAFAVSTAFLTSCSVVSSGKYNENNEFVPKKPEFKFRDKAGFVLPKNLSTQGVYQKVASYYRGEQTYPVSPYNTANYTQEDNKADWYIRFLDHGRYYTFSKAKAFVSPMVNKKRLKKADLNPYRPHYSRGYYYSKGAAQLTTESFVYGDGSGAYVYFDYVVENGGKTLKKISDQSISVYELTRVPDSWTQGVQADW